MKKSTCTANVYAKLGRLPLLYNRKFGLTIYWCKLIDLNYCIKSNCYNNMFDFVKYHKKIDCQGCLVLHFTIQLDVA